MTINEDDIKNEIPNKEIFPDQAAIALLREQRTYSDTLPELVQYQQKDTPKITTHRQQVTRENNQAPDTIER